MENNLKSAIDSNAELPEGVLTQVLELEQEDNKIITFYVIDEYKDYIPVLNEAVAGTLRKGLIVTFNYKQETVKVDDEKKEIVTAVNVREKKIKALLVGIDNYKVNPLRGCVKGLQVMEKLMLNKLMFNEDEIKKLQDEKATKKSILFYLKNMISNAEQKSHLLFYFSGHGYRQDNTEGICPSDFDAGSIASIITETELQLVFNDLKDKELTLTFICDSCYSGGILKTNYPSDYLSNLSSYVATNTNIVVIAGCARTKHSHNFPFENGYCGVLTYHLVKLLQNEVISNDTSKTLNELMKQVNAEIFKLGLDQVPSIDGEKSLSSLLSGNVYEQVSSMA